MRRNWQGDWRKQIIYAPSEEELRKRPAVIIAMRGLAAQTWREAGRRGGFRITAAERGGSRKAHNTRIMRRAAHRWVIYREKLSGSDPYCWLRNQLPYIEHAMTGGKHAVGTAMDRAARGLDKMIARRLEARAAR